MLLNIDSQSGTPIYLQIIEQVQHAISIGLFKPGEALPTIRELALQLHVNPNTVAKAFRELEREGLLVTRVGKGSFISENALSQAQQDTLGKGQNLAARYGQDMRWLGFDCPSATELVKETWEEESPPHD